MKRKSDIILWSSALILLFLAIWYSVYLISFVSGAVNAAFSGETQDKPPITRFDFEKADKVLEGKIVR